MSAKNALVATVLSVGTLATVAVATAAPAEARWRHRHHVGAGVAAGLLVGGLLAAGAAHAAGPRHVYERPVRYRRVCGYEDRVNRFGEIYTVRVCERVAY
jgi:hypothetical protein